MEATTEALTREKVLRCRRRRTARLLAVYLACTRRGRGGGGADSTPTTCPTAHPDSDDMSCSYSMFSQNLSCCLTHISTDIYKAVLSSSRGI